MHKNSLQVELGMPAWWRKIIPSKNDREIRRYKSRVEEINALEASMKALPDEALRAKTEEFRQRYKEAVAKFGGNPEERISYADTKEGLRDLRKPVDQALVQRRIGVRRNDHLGFQRRVHLRVYVLALVYPVNGAARSFYPSV